MTFKHLILAPIIALLFLIIIDPAGYAEDNTRLVQRGDYLVTIMHCSGCHAEHYDSILSGSEKGFLVPNIGIFYPPNLTSDPATGLGTWSKEEIIKAIRTGERPDGRILSTAMPWQSYTRLSDDDAQAIAYYLKNLPATVHAAPPPATVETARFPYRSIVNPTTSQK